MKKIIQRLDLYKGLGYVPPSCPYSTENPTIQNLDTSLISLLKGTDECGQVNNFTFSEDETVDVYRDEMEQVTQTQHELSYYEGLSANVAENQSVTNENTPPTASEPTVNVESISESV